MRRSARSASNRERSEASPYCRSTLSWVRRCATSASSRSVGSATTSQPNGRDMSVTSVDSNSVGRFGSSGRSADSRRPPSGGACRPGHGVHTRSARSASHSSPICTPARAAGEEQRLRARPAPPARRWPRRGWRGGVSGPALVMSSSGAPEPRESQPMTNGRLRWAADSTAGSTVTKSHSADELREGAVIAWIRYQGPLSETLGCISFPHRRLLVKSRLTVRTPR